MYKRQGLEHTGYNSYAGVAAPLFDYEKGLTAENAVTVEKENVEMVAAAQDAPVSYTHLDVYKRQGIGI